MQWAFEGRSTVINPGKRQFDLAEGWLLETVERVAHCRGWDGASL
jgi:hypothetical protein